MKKIKTQRNWKQPGETLLEVVVATSIFVLVITGVFSTIVQSMSANVNVKNRVLALNIAREGLEAVKNIRDTSWLKMDPRVGWLCLDPVSNTCSTYITDGKYTTDLDTAKLRFALTAQGVDSELDLETSSPDKYRLYQEDNAGMQRYTHDDDSGNNPASIFYRQLTLTPLNPYKNFTGDTAVSKPSFCGSGDDCDNRRLYARSTVQWKEGARVHEVKLETHLFDHISRHEY